jgi:2-methylcitrate dehydratase PrpD
MTGPLRPILDPDRARAAMFCVDWLGCALEGLAERGEATGGEADTTGRCSLIGRRATTDDPAEAAVHNARLARLSPRTDLDMTSGVSPGPLVVSAAFAIAEAEDFTGAMFLERVVHGYEVVVDLARTLALARCPASESAWRLGFAAGSAVRGLQPDAEPMTVTPASGAATAGLSEALSQQRGTPATPFAPLAARRAGGDWLLHEVSVRPYALAPHVQPAADAALRLARELPAEAVITSIEAYLPPGLILLGETGGFSHPEAASRSIPLAIALALRGEEPDSLSHASAPPPDPAVTALASAITLRTAPTGSGEVRVTLASGESVHAALRPAWGHPDFPLTAPELIGKALGLARKQSVLSPRAVRGAAHGFIALMSGGGLSRVTEALKDAGA